MPISFTRKTWKNRTDPTLDEDVDPSLGAVEFNRIEAGLDAVIDQVNENGGSLSSVAQPNTTVAIDAATGDIVITTNSVERARIAEDGTITGLAAQADVPTISDLKDGIFYLSGITSVINLTLDTALFDYMFVAVSLSTAEAHAQSDTNYWTFDLLHQPGNLLIASKTTKLTGGFPISQWTGWNFDAVTFANNAIAKDDVVRLRITPTGTPTTITGLSVKYRYEPT